MDYYVDQIPLNVSDELRTSLKKFLYRAIMLADWACGAQDHRAFLTQHWTLALCCVVFAVCASLTLLHALRHGGRHFYAWQAVFLFGVVHQLSMVHLFPNGDLQWHGQTWLTFFGRRTPGYVLFCLYPTFLYTALLLVKRLRLKPCPEYFLTAAYYTLLRLPYEVVGSKFLWWTWHSDHPFVRVKFCHVPVAVLLMHFWSVVAFQILYRLNQRLLLQVEYNWKSFAREIASYAVAAFSAPLICYMVFETVFASLEHLCSNATLSLALLTHLLCASLAIGGHFTGRSNKKMAFSFDELNVTVVLLVAYMLTIAAVAKPEHIVSTGLHQPFGHCVTKQTKPTMLLSTYDVERFVCTKHVDRYEFDFHCVRPPPVASPRTIQEWYTICGKALGDRGELLLTTAWVSALLIGIQCYWKCWTTGGAQLFGPIKAAAAAATNKQKPD